MIPRGRYIKEVLMFLLVILLTGAGLVFSLRNYYRTAYPVKYSGAVMEQSAANGLPPSLVYSVIRTESGFRPDVKSSVGAAGLMQITEDTFKWTQYKLGEEALPVEILFDGETNIKYGAALLRLLIDEFGSVDNALCAYHAGWGNVKKWLADPGKAPDGSNIENIPFGDTARYVKKVTDTMQMYESLYDLSGVTPDSTDSRFLR